MHEQVSKTALLVHRSFKVRERSMQFLERFALSHWACPWKAQNSEIDDSFAALEGVTDADCAMLPEADCVETMTPVAEVDPSALGFSAKRDL